MLSSQRQVDRRGPGVRPVSYPFTGERVEVLGEAADFAEVTKALADGIGKFAAACLTEPIFDQGC